MEAATTTTRPQPREHTLVHFEIPTSDPAKVSQFYEQLFGWKFNKMPAGDMDYWLIPHKNPQHHQLLLFSVQTGDRPNPCFWIIHRYPKKSDILTMGRPTICHGMKF